MSVRICTGEHMVSTMSGLGLARSYFPRIVKEAFLESNKDGEIKRSPDPVTMIDDNVVWFNNTGARQYTVVQVTRAPRSIVAQSPGTVIIHDAWSHRVGVNPTADYPSVRQDSFGGTLQFSRSSTAAADIAYCRQFYDYDSTQSWVDIGVIEVGESLHFRYLAAVHTPGLWTTPTEFTPRWEAHARYARIKVFAGPVGDDL